MKRCILFIVLVFIATYVLATIDGNKANKELSKVMDDMLDDRAMYARNARAYAKKEYAKEWEGYKNE